MQGHVTDLKTGKPLFAVIVVNVKTQVTVSTDEHGFYTVPASEGDKVAFTFIGYKTIEKTKPMSVIISTLDVAMEEQTYELNDIKIRAYNWTQYQADSAERRSIYKIQLQRTHSQPVMSPASALAELFSKRAKSIYRFQKEFAAGEIEKFVDTRYTPELVTELTKLEGDDIGHFMYAYPMAYDFAREATDLEIKIWIRENFKTWAKDAVADTSAKQTMKQ